MKIREIMKKQSYYPKFDTTYAIQRYQKVTFYRDQNENTEKNLSYHSTHSKKNII